MKKVTFALLAISFIFSTGSISAADLPMKQKTAVESKKKKVIYRFYNADSDIIIDYNPGNGLVSGVAYSGGQYQAEDFDRSRAGITYNRATRTITLSNFQVKLVGSQGWIGLSGDYTQI